PPPRPTFGKRLVVTKNFVRIESIDVGPVPLVSSHLRLAIISSAQKMARFALCLGLKKDPGLGQELLRGAQRFSLGEDLGTCGVLILGWVKSWPGSGSPIVTMMQPADSILRKDAPRGCGANSVVGGSLPQSKVRAVFVVVANVFREH